MLGYLKVFSVNIVMILVIVVVQSDYNKLYYHKIFKILR